MLDSRRPGRGLCWKWSPPSCWLSCGRRAGGSSSSCQISRLVRKACTFYAPSRGATQSPSPGFMKTSQSNADAGRHSHATGRSSATRSLPCRTRRGCPRSSSMRAPRSFARTDAERRQTGAPAGRQGLDAYRVSAPTCIPSHCSMSRRAPAPEAVAYRRGRGVHNAWLNLLRKLVLRAGAGRSAARRPGKEPDQPRMRGFLQGLQEGDACGSGSTAGAKTLAATASNSSPPAMHSSSPQGLILSSPTELSIMPLWLVSTQSSS